MKVFLSHASEDKAQVRKIRDCLPRHVQVWLDEDELDLGARFPRMIEKAIHEESDFVLVFLSHHAMQSDWVSREFTWALEREQKLQRIFVLPILLDDIRAEIEHGPLADRLYLTAFDHSATGLENTAREISKNLFAQISRHFNTPTADAPADFLADLNRDLTAYKEIAYKLHAAMGDSVKVLATNAKAFNLIAATVDEYNAYSTDFIQRLPAHCRKVKAHWGRNLGEDCCELIGFIEKEVYRGQIYALNDVREALNFYAGSDALSFDEIRKLDAAKKVALEKVDNALHEMTRLSASLVERIEREL